MRTLAELRETESNWWHRGLPYSHAYCPLCSCIKSGWADEPNSVTEVCDDIYCLCHTEEVAQ